MSPKRTREIRAFILSHRDRPCYDCGEEYPPEVMEFDHVRGEKEFTISSWNKHKPRDGMTIEQMIALEIAKCEVRCPTHHRLRHYYEDHAEPMPGGRRKGKGGGKGYINVAPKQSVQPRGLAA